MNLRSRIKAWLPPEIVDARRRFLGRSLHFSAARGGWAQAQRASTGYSAELIVERVAAATREVLAGRALYERDSVLFHDADFPYPIVATLLRAALMNDKRLVVVDFGGSLGSTYRQCRPFLKGIRELCWYVIEQANFVAIGQNEFTTHELRFLNSAKDLPPNDAPQVLLLSSVLHYLEHPYDMLQELLSLPSSHVVIDRSPIADSIDDHLCIQHVPKQIYDASYPCWVLSRPKLLDQLSHGWRLVAEYPCPEGSARTEDGLPFAFQGLILEKTG